MSFVVYDIVLLILFVILVSIFLYSRRKNLKKEGLLFLYKTSWGIKLINYVGKKYEKTLKALSYISVTLGYFLMAAMGYLIVQTVYLYLTTPIAKIIKAPPVAPLIPYFPKLFGMESFFPSFYFIYFIVTIIIVATVHEFSHGIFARRYNIKIKSTGFAFFKYLPAFLGAFVEQDEKDMEKASNFKQRSVLAAGVFANVLTTILFYVILFVFFSFTFTAAGVIFDDYSYSVVELSSITMINGISVENPSYEKVVELAEDASLNKIEANGKTYEGFRGSSKDKTKIALYDEAPAIKAELIGAISKINDVRVNTVDELGEELSKYSPGETITITTISEEEVKKHEIVLEENPKNPGKPWLGIGFYSNEGKGVIGKIFNIIPSYKKPHVYYETKSDLNIFIKDFLWWIVIINLLVALLNMLPVGFLDGGRFFYLTILGITGSEKKAKKSFTVITYFILLLFIILMVKWFMGLF